MSGYFTKAANFPSPFGGAGPSYGIAFNNKAYYAVYGNLLEWDGVSVEAVKVANAAGGPSGMNDMIVHGGELYACGNDGHLYKWNGISPQSSGGAWIDLATNPDGHALYAITSHESRLFVGSGGNGRLWEYTGGTLVARSPGNSYSQSALHFLLSFNGHLWASTANDNLLFRWDEGSADFDNMTPNNPLVLQDEYCVTIDSDDFGNLYGGWRGVGDEPALLKWNGVDAWEVVAEPPSGATGALHFILWDPFRQKLYGILETNGILISYDPVSNLSAIEATEPEGSQFRSLLFLGPTLYSSGTGIYRFYEIFEPQAQPPGLEADIRLFPGIDSTDIKVDENRDLVRDAGLETAAYVSLFTDQRAEDSDTLPDNSVDKRGWWADNTFGSKLWLLRRERTVNEVLGRAEQYALSALQWMIDDGVASEVNVTAERADTYTLQLTVQIAQPEGEPVFYNYHYNWEEQIARRI